MKAYNVLWNQFEGTPLEIGNFVNWMGYIFKIQNIERLPQTSTLGKTFDNAKLTVITKEKIRDWEKELLNEGNVYVGPV